MSDPAPAPLATLSAVLDVIMSCFPPQLREILVSELPVLKLQALRLALEAAQAEAANTPYVEAANRPLEFPLMTRFHHGMIDALQMELSTELRDCLRSFVARAAVADSDRLRDAVVAAARGTDLEGAFLRFWLYECARLELWLRTWELPAFEASGALFQLDREAEGRLKHWLTLSHTLPDDIHPLRVAMAEILVRLDQVGRARKEELRALAADAMELFQSVLAVAECARELPASDAIILRNEYQEFFGGKRLASAEIADLHPEYFASVNAVDQRRHRARRAVRNLPRRAANDPLRMVEFALAMMDELELGGGG